jgi:RND family efflux transporter MFP subunit
MEREPAHRGRLCVWAEPLNFLNFHKSSFNPVKVIHLSLCVVAAVGLSAACSKTESAQAKGREAPARAVATAVVRQEEAKRSVEVVGTLAAEDQVTIASQAEGAVSRVLVDLGDHVKAGQPLIELDREKLEYNLQNQKAALARALAKYGATEPGHLPATGDTPDVKKADAELRQAKQGFDRAEELNKRQLIPRQALDDADTTLRAKQAAYESALQNARNLSADIDASNAMLQLADRQLRDATIRAPFDGYVQKRLVSLGEFVKSQTPVMELVRVDSLKAIGEIPEKMAPWVQVGQPVELSVDAFPTRKIAGKVSRISPAVNTPTRAFTFEATVPNGEGLLKPGTFARVHLTTALVEPVLTIPYAAMQYRYGVYRAFVVTGDHLVIHELKTGDRVEDRMEILDGLQLGDRVALTDVDNLSDGMKVTLGGRGGDPKARASQPGEAKPAPAKADDKKTE